MELRGGLRLREQGFGAAVRGRASAEGAGERGAGESHRIVFVGAGEGVYSRDMGRGNSREGGGHRIAFVILLSLLSRARPRQRPRARPRSLRGTTRRDRARPPERHGHRGTLHLGAAHKAHRPRGRAQQQGATSEPPAASDSSSRSPSIEDETAPIAALRAHRRG
jgi:hypothetical protein